MSTDFELLPRPCNAHKPTFLLALVGCAVVWFVFVAGFVVVMDPRSEVGTRLVTPLVPNAVEQKLDQFDARAPGVDLVFLGSSVSMKFDPRSPEVAEWGTGHNLAVYSSTPVDWLALARYARNRAPIQTIWIGLEDAQLQTDLPALQHVRESLRLAPFQENGSSLPAKMPRVVGQFDRGHFEDAIRAFGYLLTGFPPTSLTIDEFGVLHFAGVEDNQTRRAALTSIDAARGKLATYEAMRSSSPTILEPLRALIAESGAARVILAFNPLHPNLYDLLGKETEFNRIHDQNVAAVRSLCGANVMVFDFLDLESFGGNPRDFIDSTHPDETMAARLTATARSGVGNLCSF